MNRSIRRLVEEDAVSPVIGVVLMVAIAVILSAMVAGMVFGFPTQVQRPWNIGLDARQVPGELIVVTVHGSSDFNRLVWLNGTINGNPTCNAGDGLSSTTTPPLSVGAEMQCSGASGNADHLIVIGLFIDGTEQVLIDTHV